MATSSRRRYSPRRPRAERREQLLEAALRVVGRDGFAALTMEGVAREADLAKTVVYDTFGNREGLLTALLEREQERALATLAAAMPEPPLPEDPKEVLTGSLATLLHAVREQPETWRLILLPPEGTPPVVRETVDRQRDLLVRQIEPIVAWGLGRIEARELDAELATHALVASCENAIRLTLTQPDRFPPERLASFAADLISAVGRTPG
ncbi:MAG TPA: helix-turn-helix domain-containing protein [Solirubrobacteraceae bacterium]|jgi:AcrR family transcriptional regulator